METPFLFLLYLAGEAVRANAKSKKKKLIWTELLEVTSPAKERGESEVRAFSEMRRLPLPAHSGGGAVAAQA